MIHSTFLNDIQGLLLSSKYWHINTTSYAEHNAYGTMYDELTGLWDTLTETLLGKLDDNLTEPEFVVIKKYTNAQEITKYLTEQETKISMYCVDNFSSMIDVENICAEICGLINHTKYRLTLK